MNKLLRRFLLFFSGVFAIFLGTTTILYFFGLFVSFNFGSLIMTLICGFMTYMLIHAFSTIKKV